MTIAAITGSAGVGKTALAVHWAHRVRDRFPDGQLYANLRGHALGRTVPPIEVLAQFLAALEVPAERVPVDVDTAAAMYRTLTTDRKMLVLLDNAADPDQVRPLLPAGSGCLVVVTGRDRMTGLVAVHGASRLTLDVLSPDEALELLARVLGPGHIQAERGGGRGVRQAVRLPPARAAHRGGQPRRSPGTRDRRLRAGTAGDQPAGRALGAGRRADRGAHRVRTVLRHPARRGAAAVPPAEPRAGHRRQHRGGRRPHRHRRRARRAGAGPARRCPPRREPRAGPLRLPRPAAPVRGRAGGARGDGAGTGSRAGPVVRLVPARGGRLRPPALPAHAATASARVRGAHARPPSPIWPRRRPGSTPNAATSSRRSGPRHRPDHARWRGCSPTPCAATSGSPPAGSNGWPSPRRDWPRPRMPASPVRGPPPGSASPTCTSGRASTGRPSGTTRTRDCSHSRPVGRRPRPPCSATWAASTGSPGGSVPPRTGSAVAATSAGASASRPVRRWRSATSVSCSGRWAGWRRPPSTTPWR